MRVALAPEAAALLAALGSEDRLPYAVAFYAGVRRSEIYRLEWPDVLDGDRIATHSARHGRRARHACRRIDRICRPGCLKIGTLTSAVAEADARPGSCANRGVRA